MGLFRTFGCYITLWNHSKTGNLIINCSLIGLLFLYSVLDAILRKKANPDPSRKLRIIYAWMKIILNAAALVSSLYSLYSSTITQVKPIEIVLVVLTMLIFVLKVLLEITLEILASKWALLKSAMILDAKEHPNTSAKVFSPLIGDVEEIEVKEAYIKRIKEKQEKE